MSIHRLTASGGTLELSNEAPQEGCALCKRAEPIGLRYRAPGEQGPQLDTSVCATCIAEALAVRFGAQHVRDGGDVTDLAYEPRCERCGVNPAATCECDA